MLSRVWSKVNPSVLRLRRRADLVLLGDSNTLIGYLPPWSRLRWSAIVAERTGLRVANLGRDGWTVRDAVSAGYVDRAIALRPRRAVVAFGVNDSNREDVDAFSASLRQMVERLTGAGVETYLMTTVWLDYPAHYSTDRRNVELAPFDDAIRKVAADLGVGLIDVSARLKREAASGNWDVRVRNGALDARHDAGKTVESKWWNNVHYNANGCRVVADEVLRAL